MSLEDVFISCYFGTNPKIINEAPGLNSYFFSNNLSIKKEVISKKWKFVYLNFPLTNNLLISSVQSKYIKFLQFLKFYPFFNKFKTIYYFDHKEIFNENTYLELKNIDYDKKSIIIRKSEFKNTTIKEEINRSILQLKYNKNMTTTRQFINQFNKNIYNYPIFNTGLIVYLNKDKIRPLLDIIYHTIKLHKQPQCQIYFSIFSKKYKDEIKVIDYEIKSLKKNKIEDENLFSPGTIMTLKF